MPLIVDLPDSPLAPKENIVEVFKPTYRSPVVDTRYTPQSDLITYVEGSSWTVNYYSTIQDTDSELNGNQVNQDAVYQSYEKIVGLEFKVDEALNTQQDNEDKTFTVTGSATLYPFLIPQVGDMFEGGLPDGRSGIFRVNSVSRKTFFKETCHVITYRLIDQAEEIRLADLERKTIRTYYFVRDFLLHGQNPILVEEDFAAATKLVLKYYGIQEIYFRGFFSREFMTMLVPGQPTVTYDHGLVTFLRYCFQIGDVPEMARFRRQNVEDEEVLNAISLWTLLMKRDLSLFKHTATKAGLISAREFSKLPYLATVRYTGLSKIVYYTDPKLTVDYRLVDRSKTLLDEVLTPSVLFDDDNPEDAVTTLIPNIKPVTVDEGYIFSLPFYAQDKSDLSVLESVTLDYLEGKELSLTGLLKLADDSHTWGELERFYYIPILLFLIRSKIRSL